ncbi:MAG: glycosyltransferase [Clostridia bacterium]|nr:glycosyltransferase [Clostridia bacterium]
MHLIFLGLLYSDSFLEQVVKGKLARLQMAPHTFQTNLLNGFSEFEDISASVINIPPMGSFPKNSKKLFLRTENWNDGKNVQVGYLNLPFIKQCIMRDQIKKQLKKQIKNCGENTSIIMYSLFEPFLDVISWTKKKYPFISAYLIQTDPVPGREDMDCYMTSYARIKGNRLVKKAKCIDGFITLTKYLTKPLEVGERPFCIVECVCNFSQDADARIENEKNICLYTGSLAKEFGMYELAEAFKKLENAELWVCGSGELADYFKETEKNYKNIKFFGFVPQEQLAEIRQKANFLINPRRPSGTYTKHSFPSKTAEYMASGKPVIMYKLEGIPDEYDQYLNYMKSETPEEIAEELSRIFALDYDQLCEKSDAGRAFIRENASPLHQAKKIYELMTRGEKQ